MTQMRPKCEGSPIYIYIYIYAGVFALQVLVFFWASAGLSYFEAILGVRDIFHTLLGVKFACYVCSRFGIKAAKIGPRGRWDYRIERAGGHNVRFGVFLF